MALTYVNQKIVNPIGFPVFEKAVPDVNGIDQITSTFLSTHFECTSPVIIDITGVRVERYIKLMDISSIVQHKIIPLLTGYMRTKYIYKSWAHQPDVYFSQKRKVPMKNMQYF